jgi:thiamine pyrophosphate-dependent acetolactate synthase large subunit-like protein
MAGFQLNHRRRIFYMGETCADFLVERLHQWGIRRIFGYPGDGINGIMGALERAAKDDATKIDFIQTRHEEMAAFMACGHAKFTGEVGVCLATSGPGAMHLLNSLITISKYWRRWSDPRLIVLVLNNGDLNMVTWEERVLSGDPKFVASQELPKFSYASYAESLGLKGIVLDDPDDVAGVWEEALASNRPVVIDAHTDPEVPPLPPQIAVTQAGNMLKSILHGDPKRGQMIKQSFKDVVESYLPH